MIEEFKSGDWRDFQQRYNGTYGWFHKENGEKLLVQVQENDGKTLAFQDNNKITYYAKADSGNVFSFLPVTKGSHQYEDTVVVVSRVPARMYKRGICKDNTSLFDLSKLGSITPTFDVLATIFGPRDDSLLLQWCKNKIGNVCLDGVFSIVREYVYIYSTVIGLHRPEQNLIELHNPIFKQEIEDTLRKLQVDILVVEK